MGIPDVVTGQSGLRDDEEADVMCDLREAERLMHGAGKILGQRGELFADVSLPGSAVASVLVKDDLVPGAETIEIFAARHHFDYTDRAAVREIAAWFRDSGVLPTLHQPLATEPEWSRHSAPSLNLIDPEKSRRIDAMDETKRALEAAEQIPFASITLHLGMKDDKWNMRSMENALTTIEHLNAFARPLGVRVLLENLQNEVTTPDHLLEILRAGHFDSVGITLDTGHAHLSDVGLVESLEILRPRIAELHLHDNGGLKDEHCWPGEPSTGKGIDWLHLHQLTSTLPASTRGTLEVAHDLAATPEAVTAKASAFFSTQSRLAEQQLQSS